MLVTNDMGYVGTNGHFYVTGRKDDIIISGAKKIAPYEIENIALEFPEVRDCACVPVSNKLLGHAPVLFVVREHESSFNAKTIHDKLAERIEPFKLPRSILLIEELPKIKNMNKIDRKALIQIYEGERKN
jgi:acyl-coenzyme A synthetase/AMP-(fatty) acid ligase